MDSTEAPESVSADRTVATDAVQPPSAALAPSPSSAQADFGGYKVWNPPGSSSVTTPAPLPESYFEPTAEELKAAWQTQYRLVERLTNAPLKTQAIRDREAKEKANRWPETTIRIKFPNQMMLEHKFPSSSTIKTIYAYVRSALIHEAKPNKFVLYEAPRRELRVSDPEVKTKTLHQLNLTPSSILHFSFVDESLNSSSTTPPLLPFLLASAADLPPPPSFDPPQPTHTKTGQGRTSSGAPQPAGSSSEKMTPKWLKFGKK